MDARCTGVNFYIQNRGIYNNYCLLLWNSIRYIGKWKRKCITLLYKGFYMRFNNVCYFLYKKNLLINMYIFILYILNRKSATAWKWLLCRIKGSYGHRERNKSQKDWNGTWYNYYQCFRIHCKKDLICTIYNCQVPKNILTFPSIASNLFKYYESGQFKILIIYSKILTKQ